MHKLSTQKVEIRIKSLKVYTCIYSFDLYKHVSQFLCFHLNCKQDQSEKNYNVNAISITPKGINMHLISFEPNLF